MGAPRTRGLAAFAAGVTAWEAVVHLSLLLNRSSPRLFGIRLSPRLNLLQTTVPAAFALVLARYAFAGEKPPIAFRWIARRALGSRLDDSTVDTVLRSADSGYHATRPRNGPAHTASGRLNVRMAAYLVALEHALVEQGVARSEARPMLRDALFEVMRTVWAVPDKLVRTFGPRDELGRIRTRQRISQRLYFREPDWVMREVPVAGGFGMDVERCVMAEHLASLGEAALCEEVLCAQDLLMARARGVRLERSGTLAGRSPRCDFRFFAV